MITLEILMLLGRLCISIIFIFSGWEKVTAYEHTTEILTSKGFTMIPLFLYGFAAIEIMGGFALLIGCKPRMMAALLLIFLVPMTYAFHNFWLLEGASRQLQLILFTRNLALFGGLLFILSSGGGKCSLDTLMAKSKAKENIES